jgi:hypothetical protein
MPGISTIRAIAARATLPIASSSRAARPTFTAPRRALQTSHAPRARYERFDPEPQWRAGPTGGGGRPGGGGGPNIEEYLRRRFGGDRAIYVYGIGIGGGGIYYVTQYVYRFGRDAVLTFSLERTPETGRLRFMDVNEAQEREVSLPPLNDVYRLTISSAVKRSYRQCRNIKPGYYRQTTPFLNGSAELHSGLSNRLALVV